MNSYVKYVLGKTSGVIVLGNNLKHLFEAYYSNDKIFVVPNGGNFNSDKNNKHDSHPVRLIYVGNLQSSKGIIDVIEAIKLLNKLSQTKFSLDVIGAWRDDTTKNECIRLVNENNLPVEFFNNLHGPEKLDRLFQSDIFIFTPREPEGHPWVVIEAMAAGLPIIATNQGAICESVQEGVNGFIVPVKDPESIAVKLKILIEDSTSRKEMGLMSRKLYQENFTEEKMINNYIKVFNRVAEM